MSEELSPQDEEPRLARHPELEPERLLRGGYAGLPADGRGSPVAGATQSRLQGAKNGGAGRKSVTISGFSPGLVATMAIIGMDSLTF
ncbi:hypothetical protein [Novosphingobium sp. PhB55]|uniref:hypothetical protein n=1 Tax=Novosphingobium sp. PhB55 TaxID=2485106 RepID=UPI0010661D4B|nr:hypothetical protein [Novosphingobium sp. PhB55]